MLPKLIRDYERFDERNYRYFLLTVRTAKSRLILGSVKAGTFLPSPYGREVLTKLVSFPQNKYDLEPLVFTMMPNHIHMLFALDKEIVSSIVTEENQRDIIAKLADKFKQLSSEQIAEGVIRQKINALSISPDLFWYQGSIIRGIHSQAELDEVINHIENNASQWERDRYFARGI